MHKFRIRLYFGIIVFLIFFTQGIWGLSDYGINWDEPVHYIRGQAYLRYLLTGKTDYSDLPKLKSHYPKFLGYDLPSEVILEDDKTIRRSIYQYDSEYRGTFQWFLQNDSGHPPLNGILASFFNYIFYQKLGIMGDIESYHVFVILTGSLLVASTFLFVSYYFGIFAGIIATLSLALYPLFFSESHFNIKDPVEAAFYSLTLFAFYVGIVKGKWKWVIISGIFAGFALGTKFNIVFAGLTLVVWLTIYYWRSIKRLAWPFSKPLTASLVLFPCIALAILYISWPYLWQNPIHNLLNIFNYYKSIGSISYQTDTSFVFLGFNTYAIQWIVYATPLVILFLTFFGIIYTFTKGLKEKGKTSLLVLIWFIVPIARVTMPNAGIYGGVRQIMEFIPAMAILSGLGANYIVILLNGYIVKRLKQFNNSTIQQFPSKTTLLILQAICILAFLPITLKLISIHPNENVYLNPLIGGLKGAKERNFADWGVTLGTTYQQGVEWLNEKAEKNANVSLVKGLHSNIPRTTLREDINLHNRYYSGENKKGEYIIEVTDYRWIIDIPKEKRIYLDTLSPVYEVKVDNVAILKIWKNDVWNTEATDR